MPSPATDPPLRRIPSTDGLLRSLEIQALVARDGQSAVKRAIHIVLDRIRSEVSRGAHDSASVERALSDLPAAIDRELRAWLGYSLRPVINATGVILHTNLGRAPLSASALEHVRDIATAYSNLEFDLAAGVRSKRDAHVDRLFRRFFLETEVTAGVNLSTANRGLPDVSTVIVNNNAGAVLLALNTLADGGEVVISRGELVEIGGSFRIPDVMSKSNAILREVGTTNRTRIADYERAITDRTRLLLRVHRSNFEITGFTEQPALDELVALAGQHQIPFMEDLGSGALFDLRSIGISGEPSVLDSLRSGVDIVTYSGDKLLGGPQAGLISGRSGLLARMRSNSLFRALRADKLTYAALEATVLAYLKQNYDVIPALCMMRLSKDSIRERASAIRSKLSGPAITAELLDGESLIGGGAAPSATLSTCLIALTHRSLNANDLSASLRNGDPPIVARVEDDHVLIDLRTVFPEQDDKLSSALNSVS